jgi:small nuclear ribonucleoprotein (snRNP)-like protein
MADKAMAEKRKKETIIDLAKYLDKRVRVKFSGGRESCGILKGILNQIKLTFF